MPALSLSVLAGLTAFVLAFLAAAIAGYGLTALRASDRNRSRTRLRDLTSSSASPSWRIHLPNWTLSAMPRLGSVAASLQQRQAAHIKMMLLRAGYFQANALLFFLGARLSLSLILAVGGSLLALRSAPPTALKIGSFLVIGAAAGIILPGIWLASKVEQRHQLLRNALPDALDMLVLCLEAGTSVNAAIQRVAEELNSVHPILAMEMNILLRQVQLGLTAGEALRKFGDRCGLDDVRELALVVLQSERYGAGVAKALRDYSESSRTDRQVKAQERAQKAAVKILMPTLLCIFPAIFIVLLGPAAFQMAKLFAK